MWEVVFADTLGAMDAARTEAALFGVLTEYGRRTGIDLVSYHHTAPPFARQVENFTLMQQGFPPEWVERYQREKLHLTDPITNYSRYQTRPVLWSDVPNRMELTPEQEHFMALLFDWLSPGDGMAVPVFGPSGRHGYVGMGRTRAPRPWAPGQMRAIHAVCETFHLRFCEVRLGGLRQDFELTEREHRILAGMARSWSDPVIGASVGLRPDALRGAVHRILAKMNVTDRASAVLRGRGLGLVDRVPDPGS